MLTYLEKPDKATSWSRLEPAGAGWSRLELGNISFKVVLRNISFLQKSLILMTNTFYYF
jgi:hypothetical protein